MLTLQKVAPGFLGALALVFVAGTVQADSSVYRPEFPSSERLSEQEVAEGLWAQLKAVGLTKRQFSEWMANDRSAQSMIQKMVLENAQGISITTLPAACPGRTRTWASAEAFRLMLVGFDASSNSDLFYAAHRAELSLQGIQSEIEERPWSIAEAACIRFAVHANMSLAALIRMLNGGISQ